MFIATAATEELAALAEAAGTAVRATDLIGVLQPPGELLGSPMPGDTFAVAGGHPHTILTAKPVDAVPGEAIHYVIHGRR